MQYSILINEGNRKIIYIVDPIDEQQIFQFVGHIQKTLHQSEANELFDEELIAFAREKLGVILKPVLLVAEINISKPLQD